MGAAVDCATVRDGEVLALKVWADEVEVVSREVEFVVSVNFAANVCVAIVVTTLVVGLPVVADEVAVVAVVLVLAAIWAAALRSANRGAIARGAAEEVVPLDLTAGVGRVVAIDVVTTVVFNCAVLVVMVDWDVFKALTATFFVPS